MQWKSCKDEQVGLKKPKMANGDSFVEKDSFMIT